MGQYWLVVNKNKREYLNPHAFGDGLKFKEFGPSPDGTMAALAVLLADPETMGRGGGDLETESPIVGRWIGDKIVIAGDYGDPINKKSDRNLFGLASDEFKDISDEVLAVLIEDPYFAEEFIKNKLETRRMIEGTGSGLVKSSEEMFEGHPTPEELREQERHWKEPDMKGQGILGYIVPALVGGTVAWFATRTYYQSRQA